MQGVRGSNSIREYTFICNISSLKLIFEEFGYLHTPCCENIKSQIINIKDKLICWAVGVGVVVENMAMEGKGGSETNSGFIFNVIFALLSQFSKISGIYLPSVRKYEISKTKSKKFE